MINIDELEFVREFPARRGLWHCVHYILKDAEEKLYICTVAKNATQHFAISNECRCYTDLQAFFGDSFHFNPLVQYGDLPPGNRFRGIFYALYPYLDPVSTMAHHGKDLRPLDWLKQSYEKNAVDQKMTPELADSICERYLEHRFIPAHYELLRHDSNYIAMREALLKLGSVKLGVEQGDFTPINMLEHKGDVYLIDFGTAVPQQPIGYDMYLYCRKLNLLDQYKRDIPYFDIHHIKASITLKPAASKVPVTSTPYFTLVDGVIHINEGEFPQQVAYTVSSELELDLSETNLQPGRLVELILLLQSEYKRDIVIMNAKDYYYGLNDIDSENLLFSGTVKYPRMQGLKTFISCLIPTRLLRRKFRERFIKNSH